MSSYCCRKCVTVTGTTNEDIWLEIRNALGHIPVVVSGTLSEVDLLLRTRDISEYTNWVSENHVVPFDEWLLWRINVGTASYGNLPTDKKHDGKVGHCYAPCPYSTQSSELRTRHMLRLSPNDPLPLKVDHSSGDTTYYMKTASKGSKWGFECTYPACPHNIMSGQKYFYT